MRNIVRVTKITTATVLSATSNNIDDYSQTALVQSRMTRGSVLRVRWPTCY